MPLNTIQFSVSELAAMFKDHLVGSPPGIAQKPEIHNSGWKFLGENKKQILIVTEYSSVAHIPDDMLSFLVRMLTACRLCLGDIAIVNISQKNNNQAGDLLEYFKPAIVILFGPGPENLDLPLNFPQFQVQAFNNTSYLSCPALEQLQNDNDQKKILWACLQKLFSL